jgi:tetratricopeptide (TPR) repeat protein
MTNYLSSQRPGKLAAAAMFALAFQGYAQNITGSIGWPRDRPAGSFNSECRCNRDRTIETRDRHAELDDARQQIEAAVKADPKSPEAHNVKGSLLEQAGNSAEALREFLEAIRLRPDFGVARIHAALILAAKGDRAAAEQHLRQAATSADPGVRRQAADALRQLGLR